MSRKPLTIVFGAQNKPNSGIVGVHRKDGRKGGGILLCELGHPEALTFGKDKTVLEDVESVYAMLWFCRKDSLDSMIRCLESLRDETDWGE